MQSLPRVHRPGLPMPCERTPERERMPSRYTDDWITIRFVLSEFELSLTY